VKPAPTARIYRGSPRQLAALARRLQAGELVAVPTETVYGLAADAGNAQACRQIFAAKGRPANDPLIVHIHSLAQLEGLAIGNAAARRLAAAFWPGPLTLILPKRAGVPDVVTSGRPSVAVRMPAHPLFRRLLKLVGRPLAAPSANPFGYVSPTTAAHVQSGLGRKIRHILDGGPCRIGVESTIVDLRDPRAPRLLRPGEITRAQLAQALGMPVRGPIRRPAKSSARQIAPGQLARHYSPRTPLTLHPKLTAAMVARGGPREAWIFLRRPAGLRDARVFALDPRGRLPGAARRLFALLRQLDSAGFSALHAELAPAAGLGAAINDRLRRAANWTKAGS
jgi:L-threonylcarbamoyladenylate synthase